MVLKQAVNQNQQQSQIQKLAMTQTLQQSIQMLQYNVEELQDFLQQKELENPLMTVDVDNSTVNLAQGSPAADGLIEQITGDTSQSLFDYLLEQVHLTMRDTPLRKLVLFLLDYVDVNGYLNISEEEALKQTKTSKVELIDAITLLQQLDPPGVGARNLQECLMLQTENDNYSPAMTYLILEEAFEDLVEHNWDNISKKYKISLSEIQTIFNYVQTLSPAPGSGFGNHRLEYIIPDLIVENQDGSLVIRSSRAAKPQVSFQKQYYTQLKKNLDNEVTEYISEKKQEYDWISRSLNQRADTILRVGQIIIEVQQKYFLEQTKELKPLLLRDVASKLKVHESTISRAVNGKYIATPFGTFELKSFFSNIVGQGENATSSSNVKQKIKQIISDEDSKKPISDAKIAKQLSEQSIDVSRRTVAKYREGMGIESSSKRKKF